jgi:hypothetical protein
MAESSYLENLGKSLVWNSTLGLFGLEAPDEDLQEWQAENPKMALASEILPLGFGTAKAMSALAKGTRYGAWAKGLGRAEKFAQHPFLSRAAQEAALMAPVELGRQGIGYAIQETTDLEGAPLSERLWQAGTDIALGGAIGGGLGLLSSAGKRAPQVLADLSSADSWQQNLRKAQARLAEVADQPEIAQEVQYGINKLSRAIREETRNKMVGALEGDVLPARFRELNSVFKGTGEIKSRMLSLHKDSGFSSLKELESTMEKLRAGGTLPEDWLAYSQFPRLATARTSKAAARMERGMTESLSPVGNGWWLGKEQEGLYVLGRKLDDGQWFVTKTDQPGKFIPEQAQLKAVTERNAWRDPETIYKPLGDVQDSVYNKALQFQDALDLGAPGTAAEAGSVWQAGSKGLQAFGAKLGLKDLADSELLGNLKNTFNRYISPTVFQFKGSPLARKIYGVAHKIRDDYTRKAQELVYGKPEVAEENLWQIASKGIKRDDPRALANMVRKLASERPDEFDVLLKVIDDKIPYEEALLRPEISNGLGVEGQKVLDMLKAVHDESINEIYKTAGALGIPDSKLFPLKKGHYGISHYWQGSLRQGIVDGNGNLVYIVGGENRKGIRKLAEGVIEEARKDGRDWRLGEYWTKERALDLRQEKLLAADEFSLADEFARKYAQVNPEVGRASFFLPQSGVGGYNRAKTAEELIGALSYSLENKYIWLANETTDRLLAKDLATLGIDQPKIAAQLEDKLAVLRGEQGTFSKLVNKTVDQVLAPVLGTDSASKIVRTLNTTSVYLDLGFGNMAYAFANMLQPMTTVLPQLSLLRECPEALQWAYDGVPLISKTGKGMVTNTLSPMKIMWESMKLMGNPKLEEGFSDFMEQMVREGVLSPRFIESYIGENSGHAQGLIASFKAGDFSGMLKGMATVLPTFSEQASRGYAMTVGYKYFNSLAKAGILSKEQVFSAAKKFTENTMFQFAASDRARILQGPVGGAWGLFKNWTMHYVGWQMQYMEAALKHGAWKPYMYSNLATSMLGGLGSSEIGASLERFTEAYTGDKLSNLLYDRWGDTLGSSMLLYGIPGAFGLSLQSQVNSPFRDPGEETQRFMGFVYSNRLKALWNSVGEAVDYYSTTGKNPAGDRKFQQSIMRALAPKMIYRSTQVVGNTLYSGSTGTKMLDLTPLEAMAYQYFNLPSTRIDQSFKISREIWEDKDKRRKLTSSYSSVMSEALEAGDGTMMFRILQRAMLDGVDISGLMNGAQTKLQNRYLSPLERNTDYYGVWGGTTVGLGL